MHNEAGGLRSVFWTNSIAQWIRSAEIQDNILQITSARDEWSSGVFLL
jgi:hypothetical protein